MKSIYSLFIVLALLTIFGTKLFASDNDSKNSVRLLSNTSNVIEVELTLNNYSFTEVETPRGIQKVVQIAEGSAILEKGAPDLSKITSSVIIPNEAAMGIKIVGSKYEEFQNIEIAPSKGNLRPHGRL